MMIGGYGVSGITGAGYVKPVQPVRIVGEVAGVKPTSFRTTGVSPNEKTDKTSGECQTCKERKYVDGSNEENVSFKTPGHIDPSSSAAVVSAHESEHVRNAVNEGNKEGNRLISASVSLQIGVCPECHKTYVSGGTTKTTIEYSKDNPYDNGRKILEGSFLAGMNIDAKA